MTDLFKPDVPAPDPAAAKLRQDEQTRAENSRTAATQDQLTKETLLRTRGSGIRSLLGSFGSGTSLLGSF